MSYAYAGKRADYKTGVNGQRYRLKPCGTEAAYKRHLRDRTIPCRPCTIAHAAHAAHARQTPQRTTAPKTQPTTGTICGTTSGRSRHQRRNETVCQQCADAYNQYRRNQRKATK